MVVFLLIVIIIILAPGLVGMLVGGTVGVTAVVMPAFLVILGLVGIGALLVKEFGVPPETIVYQQAKQAIADKYTAFYVLCMQWSNTREWSNTSMYHEPRFGYTTDIRNPCLYGFSYSRPINDLLAALDIPYSPDAQLGKNGNLTFAFEQGKKLYSTTKWYVGNGWNKIAKSFFSDTSNVDLEKLAREIERILKISK